MLLIRHATATMSVDSKTTTSINHQPMPVPSVTASTAVAPAGGCDVLVSTMTAVTMAQARGALSSGKAAAWGFNANNLAIPTPMAEAMTCPRIALRGCAKGESIKANCNTAAAPFLMLVG